MSAKSHYFLQDTANILTFLKALYVQRGKRSYSRLKYCQPKENGSDSPMCVSDIAGVLHVYVCSVKTQSYSHIALRKAKNPWSFDLSECNRVKHAIPFPIGD